MTAEEAIDVAKAFGSSQGCAFHDHTVEAVFSCGKDRLIPINENDDVWDIWITYNPLKGLSTADAYVIEVNCRTRIATLIKML